MSSRSARSQPDFTDRLLTASPWWSVTVAVLGYAMLHAFKGSLGLGRLSALGELYPPVWLAFWVVIAVCAMIHQKRRAGVLDEQTGLESLRTMDWKRFEWLVAEIYRRKGYKVDYQIGAGPDGGVDVRARKDGKLTLVQCKHRQNGSVGVNVVREMFGLMHHEKADSVVITTTSHFTPEAEAFAEGKPMELITGSQLWSLVREVQQAPSPEVTEPVPEISDVSPSQTTPCCPKCGGGMHRQQKRTTGQPFWGCDQYPACRGSLTI